MPNVRPCWRWHEPTSAADARIAAGLAACGGGAGADADTLHIGSQRGGTKAMMLASGALEGAPYKVVWSEFPATQHLLAAIGSDRVDVGLFGRQSRQDRGAAIPRTKFVLTIN